MTETESNKREVEAVDRGAGATGLPRGADVLELVPVIGPVLAYLVNFIPAVAAERAREIIDEVLRLAEKEDGWLVEQLRERPKLAHLIAETYRTLGFDDDETFRVKLAAYRSVLQRGVIDDAQIDRERLRLQAIGELSALDLRVLQIIENELAQAPTPAVAGPTIVERLDGDIASTQVVLGHLERLMIVQPSGRTWDELEGGDADSGVPVSLRLTVFGEEVMNDLHGQ